MTKNKKYIKRCRHCGKSIEYYHGDKPLVCPYCNESDFIKPETETDLFLFQKQWLRTGDSKYIGEMYKILVPYARSMIKKMLNGICIYNEDQLLEKATDATTQLLEYYFTKPGFTIESSFMGYLVRPIQYVLYNAKLKRNEENISIHSLIKTTDKEIIDVIQDDEHPDEFITEFEYTGHHNDLISGLLKIVNDVSEEIRDNYDCSKSLINLIGIFHYIKGKSTEYKNGFYNTFNRYQTKDFVEKTMMLIMQFIHDSEKKSIR